MASTSSLVVNSGAGPSGWVEFFIEVDMKGSQVLD